MKDLLFCVHVVIKALNSEISRLSFGRPFKNILSKCLFCKNLLFFSDLSFMNYFMAEISRGKYLELEEDKYSEKREKVYTFMKIPREFEKVRACK